MGGTGAFPERSFPPSLDWKYMDRKSLWESLGILVLIVNGFTET